MLRDKNIDGDPVTVLNAGGTSPALIVCEHASCFIPGEFDGLGLAKAARESHAAWDPGALNVASRMAERLNARLVASGISRLVYDCNRPPEAPSAMPAKSELIEVPGNVGLSQADRAKRTDAFYEPFRKTLADEVRKGTKAIITIHSFTPVYHGALREVELGILHDVDTRIADAMLAHAPDHTTLNTQRNAPYGPDDGVTHTLKLHGVENGIANVMIEIRNDLLKTEADQMKIADSLAELTLAALDTAGIEGATLS
ncbi:N-formylglutamate amidohydrolase [Halocynthiibacter sp. C4]|uniref:N-formylglutamate amidohydrolase n=1 Tax=Halocynthiibacter sp. C4 TaxID=2992758 RepID=UPI00237B344F|nr:N-formylglutamate amidohydrolase [Halocynthiibacter sp. C4]MDE0588518.1 N-formylglutamate amidohydrolase [Halocynthiibacter sp. C4]